MKPIKTKGTIFLLIFIILIIFFVALGFYFDWSLQAFTLRTKDFRGDEGTIFFASHRNYSGNLEVFKNGQPVSFTNIQLIILNPNSKGEQTKQEANPFNFIKNRVYELTFKDAGGINQGDQYTLKLNNKVILDVVMDPPIISVRDVQLNGNSLKIIFRNSGGAGHIWTEEPTINPDELDHYNCKHIEKQHGIYLNGSDEFDVFYNCENMPVNVDVSKIKVCIGFSTRTEKECLDFDVR